MLANFGEVVYNSLVIEKLPCVVIDGQFLGISGIVPRKDIKKMKKLLALTLAVLMTAAFATGCGSSESSSASDTANSKTTAEGADSQEGETVETTEEEELSAPVNDGAIDVTAGCTENMLIRSIRSEGDTSRLAAKLKQAQDNPKYTTKVAFLGDSITAGSVTNSSSNQYVNQFKSWWENNISYFVNVNNAGIGATDSYLGVHRVQRDVLDDQPDIIFIEFINDSDNEFYKTTMDSLVRKCLSAENQPAVILIEMTMEDGTCPQNVHCEIADAYNLPVISYHDAVLPEVEAGNIVWSDISPDNIHPNDDGHVMLAQMLTNFITKVQENLDSAEEPTEFDAESPTGDKYADAKISDKSTDDITVVDEGSFTEESSPWNFKDGWATTTGGSITFEMEFKNLGALYYKTTDGNSGIATVNIDGEDVYSLNADFTGGWGDYATNEEIYTSDESATHTVTVTVEDGDAQNFEILGWLIS